MNSETPSSPEKETVTVQVPTLRNLASRRFVIPGFWVLVVIFFFCTFFVVKCGEQEIGSVTGIELVTGTQLDSSNGGLDMSKKEGEKIQPNPWAIAALGAALLGMLVFFLWKKQDAVIGIIASVIGFASLVALHFQIGNGVEEKGRIDLEIKTEYRIGYWGALAAFVLAAVFSVLRQMYKAKQKTQAGAPAGS